jgi:hypothetical protein
MLETFYGEEQGKHDLGANGGGGNRERESGRRKRGHSSF